MESLGKIHSSTYSLNRKTLFSLESFSGLKVDNSNFSTIINSIKVEDHSVQRRKWSRFLLFNQIRENGKSHS